MSRLRCAACLCLAALATACDTGFFSCAAGCCECALCAPPFRVDQVCKAFSDTVCECVAGSFHTVLPERNCSRCPGPATASKNGATHVAKCTCPAGKMGLAASEGAELVVGPYTDSETVQCSNEGVYQGVFHTLQFSGTGPATVHRGSLLVFSCDLDCPAFAALPVLLATAHTAVHAVLHVKHSGILTLHQFTARQVFPISFQDLPLNDYVVTHRLASGDYVFTDMPSRTRERCVPCPPGLLCT